MVPPSPPAERARTSLSRARHEVERVLDVLRARTGMDLHPHRPATIERRLVQRLSATGHATIDAYLGRLANDPEEPDRLLAHLTIKVSSFFRDPPLHEVIARVVLPDLGRTRATIRAWSAGCARGEEAYTLGMLLALEGRPWSVTGTDVDAHALAAAERASYPRAAADAVPERLRPHVLEDRGESVRVGLALRARTTFRRHDLTAAAAPEGGPFDLVLCRNVLIYFGAGVQERVLDLLLAQLSPGGYLCLGHAEWPSPRTAARLEVVDRRARVFRLPAPSTTRSPSR